MATNEATKKPVWFVNDDGDVLVRLEFDPLRGFGLGPGGNWEDQELWCKFAFKGPDPDYTEVDEATAKWLEARIKAMVPEKP